LLLQRIHQRFLGFELSTVETRERKRDTSVVDPRIKLDDYRTAPDGLEEVRRRLHSAACFPAAAAGLVRAAGAHLSGWWVRAIEPEDVRWILVLGLCFFPF
jgi:hypothetical protein